MLDPNLIATLEKSLQETRNAQVRLMARLREVEHEGDRLREEIQALENSAAQTEAAIDGLLVAMRSGSRSLGSLKSLSIESTDSDPAIPARPKSTPIAVDQTLVGRLFGYGDIIVTGSGGTREAFAHIQGPLAFRKATQAVSDATPAAEG